MAGKLIFEKFNKKWLLRAKNLWFVVSLGSVKKINQIKILVWKTQRIHFPWFKNLARKFKKFWSKINFDWIGKHKRSSRKFLFPWRILTTFKFHFPNTNCKVLQSWTKKPPLVETKNEQRGNFLWGNISLIFYSLCWRESSKRKKKKMESIPFSLTKNFNQIIISSCNQNYTHKK